MVITYSTLVTEEGLSLKSRNIIEMGIEAEIIELDII
jgi:hypothetical protein